MSNKDRVFVAVYSHPGSTASSIHSRSKAIPQMYHWGIWIESKGSTGHGTSFDLEDAVSHSTATSPFGWRLQAEVHKAPPARMLGRIMIGKVIEGMTTTDVEKVLREVQLPSDPKSAVPDAVAWIQAAIRELQEVGCAESFIVEGFIEDALKNAAGWHAKGKGNGDVEKTNYTWSRTFP